ncbi:hypothetical protein HDU97_007127 [Phlyctochytrium planicorne]|nr:hypothetical protein HDU97_007127 [Phlyctochytrium planicorne]
MSSSLPSEPSTLASSEPAGAAPSAEGDASVVPPSVTKPPAPKRLQNPKFGEEFANLLVPTVKNLYISDLEGETKVYEAGSIPVSHSLYLRKLSNCEITINTPITKLLIEDCTNLTLRLNGRVITAMLEIWRTEASTLEIASPIQTLQVDMCKDLKVAYTSKDEFASIIWTKSEDIQVSVGGHDGEELKDGWYHTGLDAFVAANPSTELSVDTDQFIVRFLKGKIETELIVRVGGGYASTGREDGEAVKRKDLMMNKVAEIFFSKVDFKSLANHVKKTTIAAKEAKEAGAQKKTEE